MTVKQKIIQGVWILLALLIILIFFVAMQNKQSSFCTGIEIELTDQTQYKFINKEEIINSIQNAYDFKKTSIKKINIQALELALEKNEWIKDANLFFDTQQKLNINIEQRIPIARIFALDGISNFIDSSGKRLPVTNSSLARVMVITGFPTSSSILSNSDSILLLKLKNVCNAIYNDTTLQAQIAQLHIDVEGKFELSTVLGNQSILFGDDSDIEEKCKKIKLFYSNIFKQVGEQRYKLVDVRFKNQIVATQKNYVNKVVDSLTIGKKSVQVNNSNLTDSLISRPF